LSVALTDELSLDPDVTDRTMEGFLHQGCHERHPGCMAELIASETPSSELQLEILRNSGSRSAQHTW